MVSPDILDILGYESVGEYEKAMEYYQKIIDNWPDYAHASKAKFLINAIVPGS